MSRFEGANPFGRHSAAPFLVSPRSESIERVYVSIVALAGGSLDAEAVLSEVTAEIDGREVTISCQDGECFYVQLVAPEPVERQLGGRRSLER